MQINRSSVNGCSRSLSVTWVPWRVSTINPKTPLWVKEGSVLMLFNAGQLSIQVSDCTNFREQIQNAQENPIQAQSKSNVENLLDLDLSATAEDRVASPSIPNNTTTNILEDLGSLSL